MIKYCKSCGCEMTIRRGESKEYFQNKKKYCSSKCLGKNMVGKVPPMKGRKLNEEQLKRHSEVRKGKRTGPESYLWKGGKVELKCQQCSNSFMVNIGRASVAKFCSIKCKTDNSNKGRTKEHERIRKSKAYKIWRKQVFERDNYTCVICNIKGGNLHADHIQPFALWPELRLNLDNGRTLCVDCHKKTETYGTRLFFKHIKNAV